MVSSAATSVVLRPTRSPKCPKSAEPIGRARNAIANVASDARVADAGSEELDRGTDEAREENLAR
jgi:hypothetical protein